MFDITLKNNYEKWEDVTARNCLQYLEQNNGLDYDAIVCALRDWANDNNISLEQLQQGNDLTNTIFWIFDYQKSIKAEKNPVIKEELEWSYAQLFDTVLSDENYCTIILHRIASKDNNIILTEL